MPYKLAYLGTEVRVRYTCMGYELSAASVSLFEGERAVALRNQLAKPEEFQERYGKEGHFQDTNGGRYTMESYKLEGNTLTIHLRHAIQTDD